MKTCLHKKKSIVFLISDFMDQGFEKALRITNKKHDVIAVTISDPREEMLPQAGLIELEDRESGNRMLIDTGKKDFRAAFEKKRQEQAQSRINLFRSINLDHIEISTRIPYIKTLILFFRMRARRFR